MSDHRDVAASAADWAEAAESADQLRIPLAREEFTAVARPVRGGAVRIEKRVITEDQVLEVPVTEADIRVERRIIERESGNDGAETVEQIVIEIPLWRDRLEVQKRTRVADEILVTKELRRRSERVRESVRREEVFVEGEAAILASDHGEDTP
jgi:uncharacterized protein (TIGR02271 family)